jgi:branched-chain amino acid transport system permease protein
MNAQIEATSPMTSRVHPGTSTIVVIGLLAILPFVMPVTLAVQIAVLSVGTLSANVLLGGLGRMSFGQGLYFGVGAYSAGILLRDLQLPLWISMPLAVLICAGAAMIIGNMIVRRQGIYFVMLTLAFAQMGYFAMLTAKDLTGGENGLMSVPRAFNVLGLDTANPLSMYIFAAAMFLMVFLVTQKIWRSPFGSVLTAIRQNEARSQAMGYNVTLYKTAAFAYAGALAGLAGALHAVSLGFVPPNDIELDMSQRLLLMCVMGGAASPGGALLGTLFFEIFSEVLSSLWPRWLALIALAIIGIVLWLPNGLWSVGAKLSRLRVNGREDV